MSKDVLKKIIIILSCLALGILVGFIEGKRYQKSKCTTVSKVEYVHDSILINDTITDVHLVKEYLPVDTASLLNYCIAESIYYDLFPEKLRDSIIYLNETDTSKIYYDWCMVREYSEKVFDIDTIGSLTANVKVQYNRMRSLTTQFKPVSKVTTVSSEKNFELFVGTGISTNTSINLSIGGFFKDHYGVGLFPTYNLNDETKSVGLNVFYKF